MQRPKPIPPLPEDCCGQGCNPCVNDIYDEELKLWEKENTQVMLSQLNEIDEDKNSSFMISQNKYTALTIKDILPVTKDTSIYRFSLPSPNLFLMRNAQDIGQHLILRLSVSNQSDKQTEMKSGSITRQYTVLSSPRTQGHFDIMIKLYNAGQASQIIQKWKVGDVAEFRGPFGEFKKKFMTAFDDEQFKIDSYRTIVMLAAGTGIAPMIQVIKYVLDDEKSDTRIHLLYSCQTDSDILLKSKIKQFAEYWNFKVTYFITRAEENSKSEVLKPQFHYASVINERLSKVFLKRYFNSKDINAESSNSLFLICGTKCFEIDMLNHLKEIGVLKSSIFKF